MNAFLNVLFTCFGNCHVSLDPPGYLPGGAPRAIPDDASIGIPNTYFSLYNCSTFTKGTFLK